MKRSFLLLVCCVALAVQSSARDKDKTFAAGKTPDCLSPRNDLAYMAGHVETIGWKAPFWETYPPRRKKYTVEQYVGLLSQWGIDFFVPSGFVPSKIDRNVPMSVFLYAVPSDAFLALRSEDGNCLAVYSSPCLNRRLIVWDTLSDPTLLAEGEQALSQSVSVLLRSDTARMSDRLRTMLRVVEDTALNGRVKGMLRVKIDQQKKKEAADGRAMLVYYMFGKEVKTACGKEARLRDYLTVYGGERAKNGFNADSVYVLRGLPVKNGVLEPYRYGVSLTVMRFPYLVERIYLFLTEAGYERADEYLSKLEETVRLRDNWYETVLVGAE